MNWYISLYIIDEVVSTNAVKSWLPILMRIYLVVNISWAVWYKEQVGRQNIKKVKPVKVEEVKEWEVEKNIKQKKSKESNKVFSTMEGVYSRAW